MEMLVVGAGEMGRWIARTVGTAVAFADVDEGAARAAAEAVGGRPVPTDTGETFDVVCLAVPMSTVTEAVAAYAPNADRGVIDVSGVMEAPLAAMRTHLPERERASLHPLFAPDNAPGNVAVVADAPGPAVESVLDSLRAAGNDLFETTAAEHDEAMETVQAGAHAAVLAYALAAADVRDEFATPVSSTLDDLVETVTDGSPQVYREIQEIFPGADRVADAAASVAEADGAEFDALYRAAGEDESADGDAEDDPGPGGA